MKLVAQCRNNAMEWSPVQAIAMEWSPVQAALSDASRDKPDIYCIKIAEKWL